MPDAAAFHSPGETLAQAALKKASRLVRVRFHEAGRLYEGDLTMALWDAGAVGRNMETARAHLRAVLRYECYAPLEPWLRAADRATTSAMLAKAAETPTSAAEALSRAAALLCLSEYYERTHHLTTDDFHTLLSDVGGPAPVRAEALRLFHELHMGSPPVYVPLEDWLGFTQRHDVAEALRKTAAFALLPCAQEERGASVGA